MALACMSVSVYLCAVLLLVADATEWCRQACTFKLLTVSEHAYREHGMPRCGLTFIHLLTRLKVVDLVAPFVASCEQTLLTIYTLCTGCAAHAMAARLGT